METDKPLSVQEIAKMRANYRAMVAALQECNCELHGTKLGNAISQLLADIGEEQ